MDYFVLVQIIGAVTLALMVVSLQMRKKESFLLLQTAGTVLFVIQFFLTNQITGAVTFIIVAIRGLVFYFYKKRDMKPSLPVLIAFLAAIAVSTVLTWQSLFSSLPFIASVLKTWGTWQDNMKRVRLTSMLAQIVMMVYDLAALMYTGALTELLNTVSSAIAIWRYDLRKRK